MHREVNQFFEFDVTILNLEALENHLTRRVMSRCVFSIIFIPYKDLVGATASFIFCTAHAKVLPNEERKQKQSRILIVFSATCP